MSSSTSINGFTVIPISYPSSSIHYLYARAHVSNKKAPNSWPPGRTLFLVNAPPDATERDLILLLKPYGTVEKVIFDSDSVVEDADEEDSDSEDGEEEEGGVHKHGDEEESQPRKRQKLTTKKVEPPKVFLLPSRPLRKLRKTGQTAHVVFLDTSSLDRFFSASHSKPRPWPNSSEEPSGLLHYVALSDSLRPPLDAVRQHANSAMDLYEFELAKSKRQSKYKKGEAIVDEDGFTLVTRGGAYGQTVGGGVAVATKKFQETGETSERTKKRSKEKPSFYAFQKAEKQRNELLQLKKNWELDKAKVEKLKASRRFNPY
ncbi:ribosomal RNA-processing protein 7-domain-containing protein [Lentinula aff. lateritia]|uniref:Ribosomal RNA-processing protein 7-domain-containing protein n=1 Tax=Lentinula aff. lateritia TaxID=2804960 RepID=A0ACC1U4R9_9AGAR|nr:ribosomal RNA-processing protein 7-domain-containing protein [Lentinula aff. lateritia]